MLKVVERGPEVTWVRVRDLKPGTLARVKLSTGRELLALVVEVDGAQRVVGLDPADPVGFGVAWSSHPADHEARVAVASLEVEP